MANHRRFHEAFGHALVAAERDRGSLGLVALDHFKALTHGHAFGDDVLRLVGARLREAVRESDQRRWAARPEWQRPSNVYLAYPGSDVLVEIFSPGGVLGQRLVLAGKVSAVGDRSSPIPRVASRGATAGPASLSGAATSNCY